MPHHARRRVAALALACLACALIGRSDARTSSLREDAATNYLHAAAAHLQNDDLDRAAEILAEALDRAAASPELLTLLAQVRHRQGNLEGAVTAAEEAVAMAPDYAPAHLELGDIFRDLAWYESAIASYEQALAADARAPAARERLVRVLLVAGRAPAAADRCRQYLGVTETAALQSALGDVLVAQGDLGGALRAYERAVALDARCTLAHCGRAEVLRERGDAAAAVKAARRALAIDPHLARAHACLGRACAEAGDYLGAYGHAVKAEQAGVDMAEVWSALQTEGR